jgi:thiamine biosynthesis lipoprotein
MLRNSFLKNFFFISVALCCITLILLSSNQQRVYRSSRLLMGTTVEITAIGKNRSSLKEAVSSAFSRITEIEKMMNFYDKDSALSRLNQEAKENPCKVNSQLYYVVDKCIKFGKMTDGAFDITATSLGVSGGFKQITLNKDNQTVYFKDPDLKIDLSAAAKGYAADEAIKSLKENSVENALVNAGGDINAIGKYKDKKWQVGLRNPQDASSIESVIKISNKAIATSGNYLREHIISTQSKDKRKAQVLSATVVSDNCLTADILATSLYVMGEEGLNLINQIPNVEALLIIKKKGKLKYIESNGFNRYR